MRLFVALRLNGACEERLWRARCTLERHAVSGNFTRRQNLHLTLAFLGETERVTPICRAMEEAADGPVPIRLSQLGRFQQAGRSLWWMGVEQGRQLSGLQKRLAARLSEAGFELDRRRWQPHITLGRQVTLAPGFDLDALESVLPPAEMTVRSMHLMRSDRIDGQLRYTAMAEQPL